MNAHDLFRQKIEELARTLNLDIDHIEMEVIHYPVEHDLVERMVLEIHVSRKK